MPNTKSKPLTRAAVERFRHNADGGRIQRLWDAAVPGLGVEASKSGRKWWVFRYRLADKQHIIRLEAVAAMDLDTARDAAVRATAAVRAGADPKVIRQAPGGDTTVAKLWEQYQATPHYQSRSQDFRNGMASTMRAHVLPEWGELPLAAVKRWQVRQRIDGLIEAGKEGAARALLNRLRILFNYALEYDLTDTSPADHIKPRYTRTGRRDAWLRTDTELRRAWWIDAPVQVRMMTRWLLLTGCRRDEARLAHREQITDGAWRVLDTKNDHPLILPMMPAMEAVAAESKQTFGATGWLFPSTTSNFRPMPRSSWEWALRRATDGAWSAHVLRHTVESHMRELGISEEARDAVLNHVRAGAGARYAHGAQLQVKADALHRWHQHLLDVVSADTRNATY